jgi:hypothetical protein
MPEESPASKPRATQRIEARIGIDLNCPEHSILAPPNCPSSSTLECSQQSGRDDSSITRVPPLPYHAGIRVGKRSSFLTVEARSASKGVTRHPLLALRAPSQGGSKI